MKFLYVQRVVMTGIKRFKCMFGIHEFVFKSYVYRAEATYEKGYCRVCSKKLKRYTQNTIAKAPIGRK